MLILSELLMFFLYPLFLMLCCYHHTYTGHFLLVTTVCSTIGLAILLFRIWAENRQRRTGKERWLRWWLRILLILIPALICGSLLFLLACGACHPVLSEYDDSDMETACFFLYWLVAYIVTPVLFSPAFLFSYRDAESSVFQTVSVMSGRMKRAKCRVCQYLYPKQK